MRSIVVAVMLLFTGVVPAAAQCQCIGWGYTGVMPAAEAQRPMQKYRQFHRAYTPKLVPGAVELAPGVYTTPEITARCQAYARRQVGASNVGSSSYQSIAMSCARKLYREKYGKSPR